MIERYVLPFPRRVLRVFPAEEEISDYATSKGGHELGVIGADPDEDDFVEYSYIYFEETKPGIVERYDELVKRDLDHWRCL